MDLIRIMEMFPTQKDCIVYLERLRWQGLPECPQCRSNKVNPVSLGVALRRMLLFVPLRTVEKS